jgi:hypothetical protein
VLCKLYLLFTKPCLFLLTELTAVLIFFKSNQILVADFDFFFKQILHIALGEDGMRLALGHDEVVILDGVPLLSCGQCCRVKGQIHQVLLESKLCHFVGDKHSLFALFNIPKMEQFLLLHDLFLDEVFCRVGSVLWLFVTLKRS